MRGSVRGCRWEPVRLWLAWTLWLGCCGSALAQDLRYLRHQSWSTEDGLPQDSVHAIVQTPDGFVWIATEGGIARFDGVSFRTFDRGSDSSLLSDDTCCLATDAKGELWAGTADGLLLRQGQHFRRFGEKDGLPSSSIRALTLDPDGSPRVLTANGVAVWKGDRFAALDAAGTQAEDTPGGGLSSVNEPSRSSVRGRDEATWTFSNTVVSVVHGGYARQWKAGVELPGSRVETLFLDPEGTAWVGTNNGLGMLTERSGKATILPWLEGNVVLQVYEDREGDFWIGTETSGLHVLRPTMFRVEPRLANEAVSALAGSGTDDVWVGTRRDGLRLFHHGEVTIPAAPAALTSPFILSLAPGAEGSVWAGTPDGLNHVERTGSVRKITSADGLPDDYIQALASDGKDGVWVGTRHGLAHLRGGLIDVVTQAEGLGGDLIGALLLARNGDLWIATAGGLSRRAADGQIRRFDLPPMAGGSIVTAMAEEAAGSLWIGTRKGDLFSLEAGGIQPVRSLGTDVQVDGLAVDQDGFLWLRNRRGLERVALRDLKRCVETAATCLPQMSHYGLAEGLPSVEITPGGTPVIAKLGQGELWFATRRGVAVTNVERFAAKAVAIPVAIERFLVDETPLTTEPVPDLPFGHLRFTIEYAGLRYTAPLEVRYRYKLEGLDGDWTEAGTRRFASYTNLQPRRYVFRVQAMNRDGRWDEAGATLSFRIVPPFYRRWWFLLCVAMALAALLGGLYSLRLRALQAQFRAVLRERNRMAREIHDTLAQDLVGVSLQLDIVSQLLGLRKVEAALTQVAQTRTLVTDGLAEARRSIWELRANLAEHSLPTRLGKAAQRYASSQLKVKLHIGGAYRELPGELEDEVLRIAQEALSNVQRHSGALEAEVTLHYGSDSLVLSVVDHGAGFTLEEVAQRGGHYGVRGMGERANLIGATLTIDTGVNAGSKVKLTVPISAGESTRWPAESE